MFDHIATHPGTAFAITYRHAIPLAATLANPEIFAGQRVGVILASGNADLNRLL